MEWIYSFMERLAALAVIGFTGEALLPRGGLRSSAKASAVLASAALCCGANFEAAGEGIESAIGEKGAGMYGKAGRTRVWQAAHRAYRTHEKG